jgi:hypothetical protein
MKVLVILVLCVLVVSSQWRRSEPDPEPQFEGKAVPHPILSRGQTVSLPPTAPCDYSDEAFFRCAKALADPDDNGNITRTELDGFFSNPESFTANMNTDFVMEHGDYNHDGVLNMDDWNHENRTVFYKVHQTQLFTCFFCRHNGVNMDA